MENWFKKYFTLVFSILLSCNENSKIKNNLDDKTNEAKILLFGKTRIISEKISTDDSENLKLTIINPNSYKYYLTINSDTFYIFDLNKNYKPEIIYIPKFDKPIQIIELSTNKNEEIEYIDLPDEDLENYYGQDEFQLTDSVIIRKYPISKNSQDSNNLGFKTIIYKLSKTNELYQKKSI